MHAILELNELHLNCRTISQSVCETNVKNSTNCFPAAHSLWKTRSRLCINMRGLNYIPQAMINLHIITATMFFSLPHPS